MNWTFVITCIFYTIITAMLCDWQKQMIKLEEKLFAIFHETNEEKLYSALKEVNDEFFNALIEVHNEKTKNPPDESKD